MPQDAKRIEEQIRVDLKERLAREGDHMQVKDKHGEHVGTVDDVQGCGDIKLTKDDSPDGKHHLVKFSQVESMDSVAVYLNVTREDVLG